MLGHPPEGEQDLRGLTGGTQCAATLEQSPFLDVGVVEVAECALQLLQCPENAGEVRSVVKGRRDVDQVAEFFGVDPDLVKMLRGGVLIDGVGRAGDPCA